MSLRMVVESKLPAPARTCHCFIAAIRWRRQVRQRFLLAAPRRTVSSARNCRSTTAPILGFISAGLAIQPAF